MFNKRALSFLNIKTKIEGFPAYFSAHTLAHHMGLSKLRDSIMIMSSQE